MTIKILTQFNKR